LTPRIELFEQPCDSEDWEANAKVASVLARPVMLMSRSARSPRGARRGIRNIGFCKLKLKRFRRPQPNPRHSMRCVRTAWSPVLGDGLGIEPWMLDGSASREPPSAMLASSMGSEGEGSAVHRAAAFTAGELILPAGFWPMIDRDVLAAPRRLRERFTSATVCRPAIDRPASRFCALVQFSECAGKTGKE